MTLAVQDRATLGSDSSGTASANGEEPGELFSPSPPASLPGLSNNDGAARDPRLLETQARRVVVPGGQQPNTRSHHTRTNILPGATNAINPPRAPVLHPSLDSIETTLQAKTNPTLSMLRSTSNQLVHQLETNADILDTNLADKLFACSRIVWLSRSAGVLKAHPSLCRQRVCPICSHYRSYKLRQHLQSHYDRMRNPKLLTLTLAKSTLPLDQLVSKLLKHFARLRRRAVWLASVRSGCWVLEWTYSQTDNTYHVHLHVLIDARYIPQTWISSTWKTLTGDSYIVDIRTANHNAPRYLAKYMAKQGQALPPVGRLPGWLKQTKSRRGYGSFGQKPLPDPDRLLDTDYERICSLDSLLSKCRRHDPDALQLLAELCTNYDIPWPSTLDPPPS